MKPIDPKKVESFLASWNSDRPANSPLWGELTGTHVLLEMDINSDGSIKFKPNNGYPLKAFVNLETQEIRLFNARRFSQD